MKEFLSYLKPYRRDTILAILCIEAETVFELVIPLVMASIVDVGVANGDRHYILMRGFQMIILALLSLILGQGAAAFAARCGQLQKRLEEAYPGWTVCCHAWEQYAISVEKMQQQLDEKQQVALNSLTGGSRAAGSKTADEILADIREELSCLDRVLGLLFHIDS